MGLKAVTLLLAFSGMMLASAAMVVRAKNPVHAVLFLILTFVSAAGVLFVFQLDFLGLVLIIVYVGAIAVLFLFIVMMLDIKITDAPPSMVKYLPVLLLGLGYLGETISTDVGLLGVTPATAAVQAPSLEDTLTAWGGKLGHHTNRLSLAEGLYILNGPALLVVGLVLLVAMVGAIVLTYSGEHTARYQNISRQIARKPANAVRIFR